MTQTTTNATQIERYMDEAIETLRWCRDNIGKRRAVERLRELEITLAALSLATDHEMDGDAEASHEALWKADWRFGAKQAAWQGDFVPECG